MARYDTKLNELKSSLLDTEKRRHLSISDRVSRSKSRTVRPARIIECSQNVVELRKLIKELDKIEKDKKKTLSKIQNEKLKVEQEYACINNVKPSMFSRSHKIKDTVNFQINAGFRYKSNGDPKKLKSKSAIKVTDVLPDWNKTKRTMSMTQQSARTSKTKPNPYAISKSPSEKVRSMSMPLVKFKMSPDKNLRFNNFLEVTQSADDGWFKTKRQSKEGEDDDSLVEFQKNLQSKVGLIYIKFNHGHGE